MSKNPFVLMSLMATAMAAAFRENAYRDAGVALLSTRTRTPGKNHPAGSKLLMRFYKAKHGMKAASLEEAHEWYQSYHQ